MLLSQRSKWAFRQNLCVSYTQVFSTEDTNELLCFLARYHLDCLSESAWQAAGVYIADCIGSCDLSSLCLYDPDVLDLEAADQYHIRQCLAFFSKRADIDVGVDRQAVALGKFRDAEESCRLTNACFRAWSQGRFQFRPEVERVLHSARLKISKLLGDAPEIREIRARFGPGASTQVPKGMACPLVKVKRLPSCSANLSHLAATLLGTLPWGDGEDAYEADVEIHSARIAFVPKNAKTDRAICTEPTLNGMFQLGLGEILADCLRRVGIDIRDQSANQRAAMYGSISGETATLDLSSASDTVALYLIYHLFPEDWCWLFDVLRSAEAVVGDGQPVQLQKISSMGNGFTFPLETIVFWALAQSTSEIYARNSRHRVLVYGDDIIVPTTAAVPLMGVLRDLGFTPNPQKSFWSGSFRESCGQDYVFGFDVRPLFISDALTGADLFRIRNYYYRKGNHLLSKCVENWIHPSIRLRGPEGYGEGHLIDTAYVARRSIGSKGWGGYTFETWAYSASSLKKELIDRLGAWKKSTRVVLKNGSLVKEKFRYFEYNKSEWFRVRRLATYTSYQRRDTGQLVREQASGDVGPLPFDFGVKEYWVPDRDGVVECAVKRDDRDFFTIPGREGVVRTKIYTFEPPRLH